MLWRKCWLECRYRLLLCFFMTASILFAVLTKAAEDVPPAMFQGVSDPSEKMFRLIFLLLGAVVVPVGALILAGSGINTQTNWGMMHGFHPSMYFLLSMPLTREQMLRARSVMGVSLLGLWLAATTGIMLGASALQGTPLPAGKVLATMPNLFAGALVFYSFATFLTAFLDEYWAGMIGLTVSGILAGYGIAEGPGGFNTLAYMNSQGLVNLESRALLQAAVYLTISGALYAATWRVVQNKEY